MELFIDNFYYLNGPLMREVFKDLPSNAALRDYYFSNLVERLSPILEEEYNRIQKLGEE